MAPPRKHFSDTLPPHDVRRPFISWWRRQSPARQDRFATLGPLLSVLLFLAAIISAFWYLRNEEIERETDSVRRDAEITQQLISQHLIQSQDQLTRLARGLGNATVDAFITQAAAFTRERPEVTHLVWLGANRTPKASYWGVLYGTDTFSATDSPDPSLPQGREGSEPEAAFRAARTTRQPTYSRAFNDQSGTPVFQLHVPIVEIGRAHV